MKDVIFDTTTTIDDINGNLPAWGVAVDAAFDKVEDKPYAEKLKETDVVFSTILRGNYESGLMSSIGRGFHYGFMRMDDGFKSATVGIFSPEQTNDEQNEGLIAPIGRVRLQIDRLLTSDELDFFSNIINPIGSSLPSVTPPSEHNGHVDPRQGIRKRLESFLNPQLPYNVKTETNQVIEDVSRYDVDLQFPLRYRLFTLVGMQAQNLESAERSRDELLQKAEDSWEDISLADELQEKAANIETVDTLLEEWSSDDDVTLKNAAVSARILAFGDRSRLRQLVSEIQLVQIIHQETEGLSDDWYPGSDGVLDHHLFSTLRNRLEQSGYGVQEIVESLPEPEVVELEINQITRVAPTSELLGCSMPIVDCRMPKKDTPPHDKRMQRGEYYVAKDGMEAIGDPTAEIVIVPDKIDQGFLDYIESEIGKVPHVYRVDVTELTDEVIGQIMDDCGDARFLGWWPSDQLSDDKELVTAELHDWGESKLALAQIYPQKMLAHEMYLDCPDDVVNNSGSVKDLTSSDLAVFNGEPFWAKHATEGLGGNTVRRCETADDVKMFRKELILDGYVEVPMILERHLPGEGGSFTLIKRVDGEVVLSHVTHQMNVGGKRAGNIIVDSSQVSPQMIKLINHTANQMSDSEFPGGPGFYTIDTIRDNGNIIPNDMAYRKTGSLPTAYHRLHVIDKYNLDPRDVITMTHQLYLSPNTSFAEMIKALGDLTSYKNNKVVTIRQFCGVGGRVSVGLALTTTASQYELFTLQQEVEGALNRVGIDSSNRPIE